MKKIIRYRLSVSVKFPATHPRKGERTYFPEKVLTAVNNHDTFYITKCDDCGQSFYTCCADGGGQIADTGDYDDIYCYKCGSTNLTDIDIDDDLIYYRQNINVWPKLHTIRANYQLWQKRFEKINKGEAVLELYYWSGKPYNSKSVTICQLGKDDGIGVQELNFFGGSINSPFVDGSTILDLNIFGLANNDGLSLNDFKSWFKNYDLSETMAIIHFTKFRY